MGAQKFQDTVFLYDTTKHRIVKFEIGFWGYLTIVNQLYPFKVSISENHREGFHFQRFSNVRAYLIGARNFTNQK